MANNSRIFNKIFVCLVILFQLFKNGYSQLARCYTPDHDSGHCVNLRDCDALLKMRYKTPQTHEDRVFLSLSLCGYKNNEPYVCCSSVAPLNLINPVEQSKTIVEVENYLPQAAECSAAHEERIFGGQETKIDEFPFSALLLYTKVFSPSNTYSYNCGGSLISHRFVLTAAHCVSPSILQASSRKYQLRGVRLGEYNLKTNPDCAEGVSELFKCAPNAQDVQIESTIIHEGFNRDRHSDIALLKLSENIPFSEFIKPICLPLSDWLRQTDNLNFVVTGFGRTETSDSSDIKLRTNVGAVNNYECQKLISAHDSSKSIVEGQMCAIGVETQDSCNGDSGNGLVYVNTRSTHAHWVILGITSYGPTPCGTDIPGVYTRVSEFIPWIKEKISKAMQ